MHHPTLVKLNLSVTERCNFSCTYCYQRHLQTQNKLDYTTAKDAVRFFFPWFAGESYIGFYGGEPLLEFKLIEKIVQYCQQLNTRFQKTIHFTVTSNGSLLSDSILSFFNKHRFCLTLSFDGYAQNQNRKSGSLDQILRLIPQIIQNYSDIDLTVNSVFSPATIETYANSLMMIRNLGATNIIHAFSTDEKWEERHFRALIRERKRLATLLHSDVPLSTKTKPGKRLFICAAGLDRLSLAADGKLWGCYMFGDFFKEKQDDEDYSRFCFGTLDEFKKRWRTIYPRVAANYAQLRQDNYYTDKGFCVNCPNLHHCHVCPITALLAGSVLLNHIPLHICRMQKISNRSWGKK